MSAGITAIAIINLLGEAVTEAPLVISFIQNTVTAVEATDKAGTDKLTAVLNATEAFLNDLLPKFAGDITGFMAAVEAFVNDLVALYNAGSIFVHAVTGK